MFLGGVFWAIGLAITNKTSELGLIDELGREPLALCLGLCL
jgi:hypothetical protein